MIKHSPAERYFKYLVSHPGCYTNDYIKEVARALGLDVLGDWYLTWLRDQVRHPRPFYPEDANHTKSTNFLLREQLTYVYRPDTAMNRAMRLLTKPRVRELVEVLIMSGAPDEAVSDAAGSRFQFRLEVGAVARYRHYFWDVQLLTTNELRALIDMRPTDVLDSSEKEVVKQYAHLKRMRYTDPLAVAAKLSHSPIMSLIAQNRAGVSPKHLSISKIVDATVGQATLRIAEYVEEGGPQPTLMAQSLAQTAESLLRVKAAIGDPEESLIRELHKIKMATTAKIIPSVRQLTSGNYTTDLQPKPVAQEAEYADSEDD